MGGCLSRNTGFTGCRGSLATSKFNHDNNICMPTIIGSADSITWRVAATPLSDETYVAADQGHHQISSAPRILAIGNSQKVGIQDPTQTMIRVSSKRGQSLFRAYKLLGSSPLGRLGQELQDLRALLAAGNITAKCAQEYSWLSDKSNGAR